MPLNFACSLQVPALITGVFAWLAAFVAILTPAWQVVFARELAQWIQSGLWINCQTRPSGMYTCTYTFSESDFNFYTSAEIVDWRTPPFFAWQRRLLAILLIAQFIAFGAFVSFCCGLQPPLRKPASLFFAGAMFVTFLLHVGVVVTFSFFSQLVEYRFYHVSVSGIYEKHRGYSFVIECVATAIYFIAVLFAVADVISQRQSSSSTAGSAKYAESFVDGIATYPYRQVESYFPRPGSQSASQSFDVALRELPPLPPPHRGY